MYVKSFQYKVLNSILYTNAKLVSACDWSKQISCAPRSIRSTAQTHHEYRISAFVSQTSLRREIVCGVAKCWLFSQASKPIVPQIFPTHAPVPF